MAVRETTIIMDFIANADPLRQVNSAMNDTIRSTRRVSREYDNLTGAHRDMVREMNRGWRSQSSEFMRYRNNLIEAEYGYHNLSRGTAHFGNSTGDLIGAITAVGLAHRLATNGMMDNNDRMRSGFYRTIGTFANMTPQAQRNSEAIGRLRNPLYRVNRGALGVVASMERVSQNANAARVALEMLGPTASMKQLNDEMKRIKKGLGAMTMVAIGAGLGAFFFYKGLHSLAMENEKYAKSLQTMQDALRKAIQPMVDVFIMIMVPLFKFITYIANMISKFNEAHPVIAKMIQGTILLVPALTLLLLPLGLGLGLVKGYTVAFGYFFKMIRPIVVFLATMSTTVWIVAAAIIAFGAAFIWAWNNVAWFRDGIIAAWNWIKEQTMVAFEAIKAAIMPAIQAIVAFGQEQLAIFKAFWAANGAEILNLVSIYFDMVWQRIKLVFGIILGIFQIVWPQIVTVIKLAWALIQTIISTVMDVIMGIIKVVMALIKGDWEGAWDAIKGIFTDTWENIKQYLGGIDLMQIGKDIVMGLVKGVLSMVDAVKGAFTSIVGNIKSAITGGKGLDIHSPSRVMHQYGVDTWKGYNNGQIDQMRQVQSVTNMVANVPTEYMNNGTSTTSNTSNSSKNVSFSPVINVNAAGGDSSNIKQAVKDGIEEMLSYINTVYVTEGDI